MKFIKKQLIYGSLLLLMPMLASCISDSQSSKSTSAPMEEAASSFKGTATPSTQNSLPVRYQTPSYLVDTKPEKDVSIAEEAKLKVEAKISSTRGPQPLWDIMKRLASLKGMNVSWSSDVDRNVLVDVNINANDDFFAAIDNLLRQVDYFHELQGNTIIVKYKETRQFHIAMPFIKQTYKTKTGGDLLGGGDGTEASTNVAGEIALSSEGVAITNQKDGTAGGIEFNTWNSIENNLNSVLDIWSTVAVTKQDSTSAATEEEKKRSADKELNKVSKDSTTEQSVTATYQRSKGGNTYFIDKPVGLVTVTAPRPIIEKLDDYFKSLQRELYKQVAIEAKILEVQLDDSSSIGLNWNKILSSLSVASGSLSGGKTYSKSKTDTEDQSDTFSNTRTRTDTRDSSFTSTDDGLTIVEAATDSAGTLINNVATSVASSGVSAATVIANGLTGSLGGTISLAAFTFDSFLNAVSTQGKATILSNPKLSVLNGQPSLITVGKNVTYISSIEADRDDDGNITYSAETARALSGVGLALTANILDDNQIILNLVPVTSELVEPIEYRPIGLGTIGLPVINVREMSTTVRVKNGEMLVIGGLISSVSENEGTFIPGTSNLSFFKYLFGAETKSSKKRELIILLKPRII
jgi:MSHA type pilus biogenesis protein MshL